MAREINITDIVPTKVLVNIAQRIRKSAANIARSKNVPIKTANEIGIQTPKTTQKQTEITLTLKELLAAYEWGSGLHRTRRGGKARGKYPIRPRNKSALVFDGTNGFSGQVIITKLVQHPGVKARPFLEPAKKETRSQNLEDIRNAAGQNIRLIIRGMSRKV